MKRFVLIYVLFLSSTIQAQVFEQPNPTMELAENAGEGPAWHPQIGMLFSGGGNVTALNAGKGSYSFLSDAGTNGLLYDAKGRLVMCQPRFRRVSRYDVNTRTLEVLTSDYGGQRYNQPNDIAIDSEGRIYFSDPKYGSRDEMEMLDAGGRKVEGVYCIDVDGTVSRVITHEVDRPNGLVITPDDQYLFVADNNNNTVGGARKLWRFELHKGSVNLASRRLIYDWKSGRGPDGMVLDEAGRLYVAGGLSKPNLPFETADEFKGGVYVFSPAGERIAFVPIPHDEVTNCTFGGQDLRTLYITAGGTLWSIRTTTRGRLVFPR